MDLFQFNDDFIASAAWGMDNEETLELFAEAIRAGADVLERKLIESAGPEIAAQAQLAKGGRFVNRGVFFDIPLTRAQFDAEMGTVSNPPNPKVRRAIIRAAIPASQAMTRVLSAD